jgi:PAS domain S-box-containing protein
MDIKSYAPLTRFVDDLLDAICVVYREGRFIFVSAACKRIFGYTPEEMIGKAMLEMVVPEDWAITLQAVNEIMSGNPKPILRTVIYARMDKWCTLCGQPAGWKPLR